MWSRHISISLQMRPPLMISSSLSSAKVISYPPGWQFPHRHPPHLGSQAAPMLSHCHQSKNSRWVAPVAALTLAMFSSRIWVVGLTISSYFTAAVLMERVKWALDSCAAASIFSNKEGCAMPTVFPNGLSHKTRSRTTLTLCGANG